MPTPVAPPINVSSPSQILLHESGSHVFQLATKEYVDTSIINVNEVLFTAAQQAAIDSGVSASWKTTNDSMLAAKANQTDLNVKANLASPAFTGTPTAPTPSTSDNSTKLATTAFVQTSVNTKYGIAPINSTTHPTFNWSHLKALPFGCYDILPVNQTTDITWPNGASDIYTNYIVEVLHGPGCDGFIRMRRSDNPSVNQTYYTDNNIGDYWFSDTGAVPVGTIICRCGGDVMPLGYLKANSSFGVASDGTWVIESNSDTGMASVALYNYVGTLYGTFVKNSITYRRMPGINNNGAFLRGKGGNAAAVGTLQLDSAPNFNGTFNMHGYGYIAEVSGNITREDTGTAYRQDGWQSIPRSNIRINLGNANAAYGRRNEVAPVNYALYYYIKY